MLPLRDKEKSAQLKVETREVYFGMTRWDVVRTLEFHYSKGSGILKYFGGRKDHGSILQHEWCRL